MVTYPDSLVAEAYRGLADAAGAGGDPRGRQDLARHQPGLGGQEHGCRQPGGRARAVGPQRGADIADLRWGRAHELFGPGNGYGLSGLLEGRTSLVGALQATEVPGLRLLPPGVIPADPAALLQRPAWHTALRDIRRQADVVVIEAPPMLVSPDAGLLADLAEMVLVVADARRSTRVQLRPPCARSSMCGTS